MAINSTDLQAYIAGARQRQQQQQIMLDDRYALLQAVAQQGAALLKTDFAVSRVWLFGSALRRDRIHAESDVDLAVQGLEEAQYLRAVGRLLDLHGGVSIDLVTIEDASTSLRDRIMLEGKEL
ncbi:MAG: nucleotidyltransferase domain-containing protein [Pseudanabaena sp. CRU_2_10]|nr:nucleotidyltransferase domain-containing protein [Pseudanabaena sp. CRU_2_10]